MEIIKRGIDPQEVEYQAACHNCGTEVKFKRKEAEVVPDWRDGNFMRVDCPVCPNYITHYL